MDAMTTAVVSPWISKLESEHLTDAEQYATESIDNKDHNLLETALYLSQNGRVLSHVITHFAEILAEHQFHDLERAHSLFSVLCQKCARGSVFFWFLEVSCFPFHLMSWGPTRFTNLNVLSWLQIYGNTRMARCATRCLILRSCQSAADAEKCKPYIENMFKHSPGNVVKAFEMATTNPADVKGVAYLMVKHYAHQFTHTNMVPVVLRMAKSGGVPCFKPITSLITALKLELTPRDYVDLLGVTVLYGSLVKSLEKSVDGRQTINEINRTAAEILPSDRYVDLVSQIFGRYEIPTTIPQQTLEACMADAVQKGSAVEVVRAILAHRLKGTEIKVDYATSTHIRKKIPLRRRWCMVTDAMQKNNSLTSIMFTSEEEQEMRI